MFENGWKISFNGITNEKQFVCSCGHHWVYDETYQKDHCSACNNELFLDYDNFINTQKHLYPNDFKYTTKSFLHTDTWEVKFSCKIPLYDARLNAIGFKTNELITAVCDSSGNTTIVYIDDFVKEKMVYTGTSGKLSSYLTPKIAQELAQTIIDNRPEILDWLPLEQFYNIDKKEHLKVIQFLLKNRDVKDLDIYFWSQENLHLLTDRSNSSAALDSLIDEKHSKSVKKALYRYYYGLDITKRYDFTFDYTVLKYFDDPNYLRELIDIPTPHKELLFEDISVIEIDVAMTFFKHFYNESQLFNIFKKALCTREQFNLLHDCFRMLRDRSNLDAFVEHYTKQKVNLTAIHDELVYVQNLYVSSNTIDLYKNFEYSKRHLQAEGYYEDLLFMLPRTPHELNLWGKRLHNCMFSYTNNIINQKSVIYGVFEDGILTYAIELQGNKIVQEKRNFNGTLGVQEKLLFALWHKEHFR